MRVRTRNVIIFVPSSEMDPAIDMTDRGGLKRASVLRHGHQYLTLMKKVYTRGGPLGSFSYGYGLWLYMNGSHAKV